MPPLDAAALSAQTAAVYRLHNSRTLYNCRENLTNPGRFESSCAMLVQFLQKKASWEWADVVLIVDCLKAVRAFGVRRGYPRAPAVALFDCLTKLLSTQKMDDLLDLATQVRIFEWSAQLRTCCTVQPDAGVSAITLATVTRPVSCPPPKDTVSTTCGSQSRFPNQTDSAHHFAVNPQATESLREELLNRVTTELDFIRLVHEVLGEDNKGDSDIMCLTDNCRVSLNCPGSLSRIKIPMRGKECKHLECFDLDTFVALNAQRPKWKCLHCDRPLLVSDVAMDGYMAKILNQTDAEYILVHRDGRWEPDAGGCGGLERDNCSGKGNDESVDDVIVID